LQKAVVGGKKPQTIKGDLEVVAAKNDKATMLHPLRKGAAGRKKEEVVRRKEAKTVLKKRSQAKRPTEASKKESQKKPRRNL